MLYARSKRWSPILFFEGTVLPAFSGGFAGKDAAVSLITFVFTVLPLAGPDDDFFAVDVPIICYSIANYKCIFI